MNQHSGSSFIQSGYMSLICRWTQQKPWSLKHNVKHIGTVRREISCALYNNININRLPLQSSHEGSSVSQGLHLNSYSLTFCNNFGDNGYDKVIIMYIMLSLHCFFLPEEKVAKARAYRTVVALNIILVMSRL